MPRIPNEAKVLDYMKYENLLNAIATEAAFSQDPLYRCFICQDILDAKDG